MPNDIVTLANLSTVADDAPRVLRVGADLPDLSSGGMVQTVYVACNEGSIRLRPCPSEGMRMSRGFYKMYFVDGTLRRCAESAAAGFPGIAGGEDIVIGHVGLFNDRTTAEGNFTQHSIANALDLTSVRVGTTSFWRCVTSINGLSPINSKDFGNVSWIAYPPRKTSFKT